ncbi:MAG: GreA/GreB family elongation factor [Pseudomonadota bacterium]
MSVAFRRESDDEHLEPKFEIPIAPGPNLVTPRGLRQIASRLADIDAQIAHESDPDLLKVLRRDQRYWATRQSSAEPAPTPLPGEVGIGSRVTLRIDGKQRMIEIVGGDEADSARGRVAFSAPLARAVMGAMVGETIDFAGRTDAIEIVAIAPFDTGSVDD